MLELSPFLQQHLPRENTFDWLIRCQGTVFRDVKNRRTVRFEVGGRAFFIKIHRGCGWGEILKNWLSAKSPILSAENEWRAIELLDTLGVSTMKVAGKGIRGSAPARLESFVVTEALEGMTSLEELLAKWNELPAAIREGLKHRLIERIARVARVLHESGMNHRDFYLCHFLVRDRDWGKWRREDELNVHLIDLHRVQIRGSVPLRWKVKDLGGLLFSALDAGLSRRDLLRFLVVYGGPGARSLAGNKSLWRQVAAYARWMYRDFHRKEAPAPLD